MQIEETKFKAAGEFTKGAAINAIYRDRANKGLYTAREQAKAETLKDIASMAFPTSEIYVNYRKTFFAIKIEDVSPARMKTKAVKDFESVVEQYKSSKIVTPQGLIYRVYGA